MKTASKILSGAICLCALFFTACTSAPKVILLSQSDVDASSDALYAKFCASGALDEIASAYEGEKPTFSVNRTDTEKLDSRNRASGVNYARLAENFAEKLNASGAMLLRSRSRVATDGAIIKKIRKGIGNNYANTQDDVDDITTNTGTDFTLYGRVSSTVRKVAGVVSIDYRLGLELLDGDEVVWSDADVFMLPRKD
ncbi:hypothetical protein [Candidatus Spyradosoma sp. SGI.093]|uniref:hypothetical protein n=1 Tax=Candidatus Spyradosoma sp. SGI.093 TaxID=3420583 RepID=UPI003D046AC5